MPTQTQWQYIFVTQNNNGEIRIVRPDGGPVVAMDKHVLITLNNLGQEGWEMMQQQLASDSSGITYIMKRTIPTSPPEPGIN